MKGIAHISLPSGKVKLTELHWYEAHGIGKKEIKRSRRKKAARLISGVSELTRMRCLYESREIT